MRATSFMGSTLERMTLPHHRRSILEMVWTPPSRVGEQRQ
jgi:hypothetical protein